MSSKKLLLKIITIVKRVVHGTRKDILEFLKANRKFFRKQFHIVKIGLFDSFA
ncbi:MAG: hypothetical protein JW915_15955 [Chitinispirillaceae bacterium]|nr:hypothetical protein [Chitinispirillaceae bacterium]